MSGALRLVAMASGSGTDFQSIVDAIEADRLDAEIALLVCNVPGAPVLARAKKHGVPAAVVDHRGRPREDFERDMMAAMDAARPDMIVMAGFMRLLTPLFIGHYRGRMVNIHPALLPSFPGAHGFRDALAHGVKVSGCTVHFVTEEMDSGPIIAQRAVPVLEGDTESSLKDRIQAEEHRLLPEVLQWFAEGRVSVRGRLVSVAPPKDGGGV